MLSTDRSFQHEWIETWGYFTGVALSQVLARAFSEISAAALDLNTQEDKRIQGYICEYKDLLLFFPLPLYI